MRRATGRCVLYHLQIHGSRGQRRHLLYPPGRGSGRVVRAARRAESRMLSVSAHGACLLVVGGLRRGRGADERLSRAGPRRGRSPGRRALGREDQRMLPSPADRARRGAAEDPRRGRGQATDVRDHGRDLNLYAVFGFELTQLDGALPGRDHRRGADLGPRLLESRTGRSRRPPPGRPGHRQPGSAATGLSSRHPSLSLVARADLHPFRLSDDRSAARARPGDQEGLPQAAR